MKKIIIGVLAITLSISLSACGTSSESATLTSLGNQLDDTSNTISNIQTVNPTDLSMSRSMMDTLSTKESSTSIYNTQQNLLNEEYYKIAILNQTAKIKNCLSQEIKLSKAQTTAVKDLIENLSKYTNSIEYSKDELESAVKSISSMKKNVEKNLEKINSKLNRIACNCNARTAYYENILNTLTELEICLDIENCFNQAPTQTEQTLEEKSNNTEKKGLIKNIDTYISNENEDNVENDKENTEQPALPQFPQYPYNQNQIYGNPYNRMNHLNPNRNTDTYGPTTKNIDTFGNYGYGNGIYPNGMYGLNNGYYNGAYNYGMNGMYNNYPGVYNSNNINRLSYPIAYANTEINPRLEDFEEIKEDNSIEKIEPTIINKDDEETNKNSENCEEKQCQAENCNDKDCSIELKKETQEQTFETTDKEDSLTTSTTLINFDNLAKLKTTNTRIVDAKEIRQAQEDIDLPTKAF